MTQQSAYLPTQGAEFSGPDRHAVVLYSPGWTDRLLSLLEQRPTAYEAVWHFLPSERSHVLEVTYEGDSPLRIALVDGVHNALIASLVKGRALVLSPFPLYQQGATEEELFAPERSLLLPQLPNLLEAENRG